MRTLNLFLLLYSDKFFTHQKEKAMGNTQIKLELALDEVNGVLSALGNMPYAQVSGLIEKIREQAIPQVPVPQPSVEPVEESTIQ